MLTTIFFVNLSFLSSFFPSFLPSFFLTIISYRYSPFLWRLFRIVKLFLSRASFLLLLLPYNSAPFIRDACANIYDLLYRSTPLRILLAIWLIAPSLYRHLPLQVSLLQGSKRTISSLNISATSEPTTMAITARPLN